MRQVDPSPQTTPETPRLRIRVRDKIRLKHYSIRTEQAYTDWIKRFILLRQKHDAQLIELFIIHDTFQIPPTPLLQRGETFSNRPLPLTKGGWEGFVCTCWYVMNYEKINSTPQPSG